ncbi:MAG: hypothetical protein ABL891_10525 [Burkholderiales bacterium]
MANINAAAGRRVAIIRRAFSSVPIDYAFSATAAAPGQSVSGTVEIRKSRWIIPGSPVTLPLQEHNVVSAGLWNTFMSVDVVPAVDVVITTGEWNIRNLRVILLLAVVIVAMAVAVVVVYGV